MTSGATEQTPPVMISSDPGQTAPVMISGDPEQTAPAFNQVIQNIQHQ